MYKIVQYLMVLAVFLLSSCSKEDSDPIIFNPTDHIISTLGSKMRFVIKVPEPRFYNFSSNDSDLNCEGSVCIDILVAPSEMNELAQNLSDTIIFQWEFMTAGSPYPEDHCEFLIYGGINEITGENYFMCTIGKGKPAIDILRELSKAVTGEAKAAFAEVISFL
jgi:hypothetical protein